ncbi:RNA polymerase sigma factor [Hymenobacter metallilatus]|uniref:Sigma-70 family RNA polymerase sigma factor n=1 Tax=Hymenobacter metallilatus TaxID=2493666 RepID=A0A428JJT3_9BACT|nr:sigma-70 family RNA polymerase sigma factor [Hymenobacter metallilatus]RSK33091.1 sigma-70 family RNA polymerase sigma factor [Hymenobacter metallilatus]
MAEREFIQQIQAHQGLLNKLVYLYAEALEDRQDLHQEILLQAWKAYPQFRGTARFSTWLYRIGLNVALTSLTRTKRGRGGVLPADGPSAPAADFEAQDRLRYVLQQFSPVDRTLLVMTMEGYANEEIADSLGLNHGAVRTRLHRLRQRVEQLWP